MKIMTSSNMERKKQENKSNNYNKNDPNFVVCYIRYHYLL